MIGFSWARLEAQEVGLYESKLQINPAIGGLFSTTNLFAGEAPDHLIVFNNNVGYWQVVSATYFFHRRVGVQFDVQLAGLKRNNINVLRERVLNEFGADQYYLLDKYQGLNTSSGSYGRGLIGLVYRFEVGRWFFNPKMSVAFSQIRCNETTVFLKQKDSHQTYEVRFYPKTSMKGIPVYIGGLSAGYKLSSRVYIHADITANYFRSGITYYKSIRNVADGESTYETIDYDRKIFQWGASIGANIVFVKYK